VPVPAATTEAAHDDGSAIIGDHDHPADFDVRHCTRFKCAARDRAIDELIDDYERVRDLAAYADDHGTGRDVQR
jgi:hypothetical protein